MKEPFSELTQIELMQLFKETKEKDRQYVFKQMIEYFRRLEKDKQEMKGDPFTNNIGGIETAKEMVTQGYLSMQMFLSILPAVENYDQPYEITSKAEETQK